MIIMHQPSLYYMYIEHYFINSQGGTLGDRSFKGGGKMPPLPPPKETLNIEKLEWPGNEVNLHYDSLVLNGLKHVMDLFLPKPTHDIKLACNTCSHYVS